MTKQGNVQYCDVYGNTAGKDFVIKHQAISWEKDCTYTGNLASEQCSLTMNIPTQATDIVKPVDGSMTNTEVKTDLLQPLNPVPDNNVAKNAKKAIPYETLFVYALIMSIVIETIVLILLLKSLFKKEAAKIKIGQMIFTGIIATAVTIPYLWFVLPSLMSGSIYVIVGEVLVFLVEGVIINQILKLKMSTSMIVSFICNLVSFLLGLLLMRLL